MSQIALNQSNLSIVGDLTIDTSTNTLSIYDGNSWQTLNNSIIIGEQSNEAKLTLFQIDYEWQSRKPIKIREGLILSKEEDLISDKEIKNMILEHFSETDPDLILKMDCNIDKLEIRKKSFPIEVNNN